MDMNTEKIGQWVKELISAEPDLFLVETRIKPTNNVKIYIDGDNGVSIDKLVQYNRKLYRQIEESGLFPNGDFSLELSSPGLDEPLKLYRQYVKNIGRFIEVTDHDGVWKEGKLLSVNTEGIVLEEHKGQGKKKEIIEHSIPMEKIKIIKVQIKI